jgi:hypothetical protein
MRILASNPDTLGDMVLRQPLYRALREAGHELTLIVRPSVAPLVPYVAPGAAVIRLPYEVYASDVESRWAEFAATFAAARAAAPELLLVAPYRWTAFEEKLADELPGVRPLRRGCALTRRRTFAKMRPRSARTPRSPRPSSGQHRTTPTPQSRRQSPASPRRGSCSQAADSSPAGTGSRASPAPPT